MLYRGATLALAVILVAGLGAWGADKKDEKKGATREVTIVKAGPSGVTVLGSDGKEHTHPVAKDAVITCNGKACKAADLKKGIKATVTVTGKGDRTRFTKIEARTEKKPK